LTDDAVWNGVSVLILQNEVPEAINLAAAAEARRRGVKTVLNAAPWRPLGKELRHFIDVLVVNAVEAEMMGTEPVCCLPSAAEAAKRLADQFETVIVTAGSIGLAAWGANDERLQIPAEKVQVVSSHGAGDAFIGTLAAQLATGGDLEQACRAASAAAARHVAGQ
jgi:ribokinase